MPDTTTTNLNLTKVEVGASNDTWGTKLNTNADTIDALFSTGPALLVTRGGTGATTAATARTNLGLAIGTNVQAYDADLAALAGLTSAADRLPYYTGAGTAALATFTSAGRALVDDADAATQRTTLGLGTAATLNVGTTANSVVQLNASAQLPAVSGALLTNIPVDPDLAAIAALTSAANTLPYFTGSGTAALANFTAAGRALVDDADAAAQRSTLGLGTASTLNVGTTANSVVQLDGSARLPAVDGSLLTNVSSGLDAELAAIAALTSAADRLPYYTGSGTAALATFTSAGRALVDDADATAQRTTLGLGSAATLNVGTTANSVVQLDASARLPAVSGALLTNVGWVELVTLSTGTPTASVSTTLATIGTYRQVMIRFSNVSHSGAGTPTLNVSPSEVISLGVNAATPLNGQLMTCGFTGLSMVKSGNLVATATGLILGGATTSIQFYWSDSSLFDGGQIIIYGMR